MKGAFLRKQNFFEKKSHSPKKIENRKFFEKIEFGREIGQFVWVEEKSLYYSRVPLHEAPLKYITQCLIIIPIIFHIILNATLMGFIVEGYS